jgi:hypothetical protein
LENVKIKPVNNKDQFISIEIYFILYLELITNVSSCYLFTLCDLCGTVVKRGVCLPDTNTSQCQCFTNTADPSNPYTGEFCTLTNATSTLSASSPSSSNWTPILIGVLAGLAGLCCLLAVAVWRRRRRNPREE